MMKKVFAFLMSSIIFFSGYSFTTFSANENTSEYFQEKIDFYESFNVGDPQAFTDEEFFGKWDGEKWEVDPAFDYENFPCLVDIEEAAKTSDYAAAKEATLEYYRQRFKEDKYESTVTATSKSYRLLGELAMENTMIRFSNLVPMEKLTLVEDEKWYEADLIERVLHRITTTTSTRFNIRLHETKKDGYMAQFWTKESDKTPYVKIIVNGAERTYYPLADNTVRAGDFLNTSYSNEEYMYANESYTTIGKESPIDNYTRRACMLFDFSDITANDTISSAKLFVYGKMIEDDNPERPEEIKTSMSVFVLDDAQNLNWIEEGHSWLSQSQDDSFSYDGEYGPNLTIPTKLSGQWSAFVMHQQYMVKWLTDLYRGTGDEAYAYHAIRLTINSAHILRDDFTQVTQYFMQLATRNSNLVTNLYTLIKSDYMTPEYFTVILKLIHMQNDYLVEGWSSGDETNNIGSIVTAGLMKGALTIREFKKYSAPKTGLSNPNWPGSMQGGWRDVGIYRSIYKLKTTVFEDGSCVEIPIAYLMTNVTHFFECYEWAEEIGFGEEMAKYVESSERELLRKVAYYVVNMQNPIKGVWQIGDDSKYVSNNSSKMCYIVKFFGINDDPVIEWGYSKGENGAPPENTSYVSDTVQKAVLRSNWTENAVALYMDADGGVGSHAHNDDLSLGLMAYGKYLLVDPLKHTYNGDQKIVSWQVSTRAHNTIEINNATQRGMVTGQGLTEEPFGEELYFPSQTGEIGSLNPETRYLGKLYDYMEGDTNGYKNNNALNGDFKVSRNVLFVKPGYFIVTDYIKPENTDENTYKQAWHLYPGIKYEIEEDSKNIVSKDAQGANLIIAPVDSNGEISLEKRRGYYSTQGSNTPVIVENEYVTYNKQKNGTTTYNTILYPLAAGEIKDIQTADIPLDVDESVANAFSAIITDKNSGGVTNVSYYTLFDDTQKADRKFGYYRTDGTLAFVEKIQDNYSKVILKNATKLSVDGGNAIVENGNIIKDIGIKNENYAIEIDVKDESDIDVDTFRLYSDDNIKSVTINGRSVYFEQRDGYVYLRETGIPEDVTDDTISAPIVPEHSTGKKPSGCGGSSSGVGSTSGESDNPENDKTGIDTPVATDKDKESFSDISAHWAEKYILEASEKKLVNGDGKGNFKPDDSVTRAELITMLMRAVEGNDVNYNGNFSDVVSDDWFALAVAKALSLGIISEDTKFRPNDCVTREEMCKMIVNVYTILSGEIIARNDITFSDGEDISSWAEDFVKKAVSAGLMNGVDKNSFAPRSGATRAQVATVICRMLKN